MRQLLFFAYGIFMISEMNALLFSSSSSQMTRKSSKFLSSSGEAEKKQEFTLNVGHAIDSLRSDVPNFLTKEPDMTVFAENLKLRSFICCLRFFHSFIYFSSYFFSDPTGLKLQGKNTYKVTQTFFLLLPFLI